MKRLAALVAALALVAAAVWLRGRLTDDDGASPGSSPPVSRYRLLCVTELRDVCEALDGRDGISVEVESAGRTEQRLAAGEAGLDGWLTPRSWADVVGVTAPGALGAQPEPVAHASLVMAARSERLAALQAACAPLRWRCVGDQAGTFRIGADRPTDGAWGLAVLGQQAAGWFPAGAPVDVHDGQFRAWLAGLKRSASEDGRPDFAAATQLVVKPGLFDAVGTVGVGVPELASAAPIDPAASVELVLAVPVGGGAPGQRRLTLIRQALTSAGWTPGGSAAAPLPSGGTLVALRTLWEGISR